MGFGTNALLLILTGIWSNQVNFLFAHILSIVCKRKL